MTINRLIGFISAQKRSFAAGAAIVASSMVLAAPTITWRNGVLSLSGETGLAAADFKIAGKSLVLTNAPASAISDLHIDADSLVELRAKVPLSGVLSIDAGQVKFFGAAYAMLQNLTLDLGDGAYVSADDGIVAEASVRVDASRTDQYVYAGNNISAVKNLGSVGGSASARFSMSQGYQEWWHGERWPTATTLNGRTALRLTKTPLFLSGFGLSMTECTVFVVYNRMDWGNGRAVWGMVRDDGAVGDYTGSATQGMAYLLWGPSWNDNPRKFVLPRVSASTLASGYIADWQNGGAGHPLIDACMIGRNAEGLTTAKFEEYGPTQFADGVLSTATEGRTIDPSLITIGTYHIAKPNGYQTINDLSSDMVFGEFILIPRKLTDAEKAGAIASLRAKWLKENTIRVSVREGARAQVDLPNSKVTKMGSGILITRSCTLGDVAGGTLCAGEKFAGATVVLSNGTSLVNVGVGIEPTFLASAKVRVDASRTDQYVYSGGNVSAVKNLGSVGGNASARFTASQGYQEWWHGDRWPTATTLNGRAALRLTKAPLFMSGLTLAMTECTVFVVYNRMDWGNGRAVWGMVRDDGAVGDYTGSATQGMAYLLWGPSWNDNPRKFVLPKVSASTLASGYIADWQNGGAGHPLIDACMIGRNAEGLTTAKFEEYGPTQFADGVLRTATEGRTLDPSLITIGTYHIAKPNGYQTINDLSSDMIFGEFILFDRALASEEKAQVVEYLRYKWNVFPATDTVSIDVPAGTAAVALEGVATATKVGVGRLIASQPGAVAETLAVNAGDVGFKDNAVLLDVRPSVTVGNLTVGTDGGIAYYGYPAVAALFRLESSATPIAVEVEKYKSRAVLVDYDTFAGGAFGNAPVYNDVENTAWRFCPWGLAIILR